MAQQKDKILIDPKQVLGFQVTPTKTVCYERDAIVYALGVGFSQDPLKDDELQYTYEHHENFKVFPTFSTCLHKSDLFEVLLSCKGIPEFNPMMVLHGEQQTKMIKPLVAEANYVTRGRVVDVADKGKGALVAFLVETYEVDSKGQETLAVQNINSCFIRGLGGFGFKGLGDQYEQIGHHPNRQPDKIVSEKTTPNQAIIYRLSGDLNPLHIDQNMSDLGGFEKPILHGLCFYGITAKIVIQTFCKGDGDKLKNIAARFTSFVIPGDTLIVSMWKEGSRVQNSKQSIIKIHFTTKTKERGLDAAIGHIDIVEHPKL